MKEYMIGIGFWQRLEGDLNPPTAHESTTEPVPNQPVAPAIEETRSEAGSVVSVDGVTAREYRAYMRRQRLYRDRLEREQARLRGITSPTTETTMRMTMFQRAINKQKIKASYPNNAQTMPYETFVVVCVVVGCVSAWNMFDLPPIANDLPSRMHD